MIADWRTAGPQDPACDFAVPRGDRACAVIAVGAQINESV